MIGYMTGTILISSILYPRDAIVWYRCARIISATSGIRLDSFSDCETRLFAITTSRHNVENRRILTWGGVIHVSFLYVFLFCASIQEPYTVCIIEWEAHGSALLMNLIPGLRTWSRSARRQPCPASIHPDWWPQSLWQCDRRPAD